MFKARARLCARDRRPYLAVTEDIAAADDHGATPNYHEGGMDDAPSLWKHRSGRDMPDTGPFMSIFILIEYDTALPERPLLQAPMFATATPL